jgi:hypothetical protein
LVVNDNVVVTDLGRERAMKLGFDLVREADKDNPQSAPVRPYITKQPSPSGSVALNARKPAAAPNKNDLEKRVYDAVVAKVGNSVDPKLLQTIIKRVLRSVGGG